MGEDEIFLLECVRDIKDIPYLGTKKDPHAPFQIPIADNLLDVIRVQDWLAVKHETVRGFLQDAEVVSHAKPIPAL